MNLELKNYEDVIVIYTKHWGKQEHEIISPKRLLEFYTREYHYHYEIFEEIADIVEDFVDLDLDDDDVIFENFIEELKKAKEIFADNKMLLKITGKNGAITKLTVNDREAAEKACFDYLIDNYDGQSMEIVDVKKWRDVEDIVDRFGNTLVGNLTNRRINLYFEDLTDLADYLNEKENEIRDNPDIDDIDHLIWPLDICDLPTFGDKTPDDTHEIYSWDEENFLMHDSMEYPTPWHLVARN